jgi:hypothetical protein
MTPPSSFVITTVVGRGVVKPSSCGQVLLSDSPAAAEAEAGRPAGRTPPGAEGGEGYTGACKVISPLLRSHFA